MSFASAMKINELQSLSKLFIYPVYWINLETSKNRKNHMITELNKLNIKHFRINAIDGKKLTDFDISPKTMKNNTLGEIGCALSHLKAIKTSFNNNDSMKKKIVTGIFDNIKTLFIQNGLRSYSIDVFRELDTLNSDTKSTFFVDYMLTFGSTIGELYSRYIKGNIVPIGSIKNNLINKINYKK